VHKKAQNLNEEIIHRAAKERGSGCRHKREMDMEKRERQKLKYGICTFMPMNMRDEM
jgi:hypothetical protein